MNGFSFRFIIPTVISIVLSVCAVYARPQTSDPPDALQVNIENIISDPNVWFGNVENLAAEKIGAEMVTYVSNIYKYYIAYRLILHEVNHKRKMLG